MEMDEGFYATHLINPGLARLHRAAEKKIIKRESGAEAGNMR